MTMSRDVWVLGAGFSAGLGGPLLKNLLTQNSLKDVLHSYRGHDYFKEDMCQTLVTFYRDGLAEKDRKWTDRELWEDAEDSLGRLDAAARGQNDLLADSVNDAFKSHNANVQDVLHTAKRLVAAECMVFLNDRPNKSETWETYDVWSQSVRDAKDTRTTILTFNYDMVLESLEAFSKDRFVIPGTSGSGSGPGVSVFKLHGSVNWKKMGNRVEVHDGLAALSSSASELAIATPGPSKNEWVTGIREYWEVAINELREADRVFFVGYRFPPSASRARKEILGTLLDRKKPPQCHVFLGPDSLDERRMERLLHFASGRLTKAIEIKGSDIHIHPVYAQDLFSVYDHLRFAKQYDDSRTSS